MQQNEQYVYLNGRWLNPQQARVSFNDRGFMLADGIYEVVRVYDGKPFALQPHIERLLRSAQEIELSLPLSAEELAEIIAEAPRRRGIDEAQVYIQLTRGAAERTHHFPPGATATLLVYASPPPGLPPKAYTDGGQAIVVPDERWLRCDIKSIMLLANGLAKQRARQAGAVEALLEREGVGMTEGSSSNLFIVQKGTLITAPAGRYILRGVTRDIVLRLAREQGVDIQERFVPRGQLFTADELFVTSTNMEVLPITVVDGQKIGDGRPGPVTRRLMARYGEVRKAADVDGNAG